ncbi:MAG TPA: hypothetical protein VGD17_16325 [Chitinophagaceae bacterium]
MKRIISFSFCLCMLAACNSEPAATVSSEKEKSESATPVQFPYTPAYTSTWTDSVSDQDVLTVLNSYKYWETNDMKSLANVMADTVEFMSHSGFTYDGPKAGLLEMWTKSRDSLSKVTITVDAWRTGRSDKNHDIVSVWYKEIDTYKDGRVDSAYYEDDNVIANGKIVWYAQHKRILK